MQFRLAEKQDLIEIIKMYKEVVKNMNANGLQIWDESYPFAFFESDIQNKQFYVLEEDNKIISAVAMCDKHIGENVGKWENVNAKAFYLSRFAVDPDYLKQGIGSLMVNKIKEIAKELGAQYLRLFVVIINKRATQFYEKNGFRKVEGILDTFLDDGSILHEFGYEMEI
ncbi:MAG TPA: GNAT family N-acetyltransferase [Bacilli bacterium]|nr:GNAT family N-acetyltransferase [Bacilli bacterium]HQO93547.1 GNAT family N-acetyltransferase [Bacilli bacterium]HQQ38705.1 GNAT family N-acetyltransferase [Bacilli bacterium]